MAADCPVQALRIRPISARSSKSLCWQAAFADGDARMHYRLIAPVLLAAFAASLATARAQTPFPAPLPGEQGTPPSSTFPTPSADSPASPFGAMGPLGGMAIGPQSPSSDLCMREFLPLRAEAERRGDLLKAAGDRHASAEEACKLIGEFIAAEVKMLTYAQVKGAACGMPPAIVEQLKTGHRSSEQMRTRICAYADAKRQSQEGVPQINDFGDPAFKQPSGLFKISPEPPSKERTWIGDPPITR